MDQERPLHRPRKDRNPAGLRSCVVWTQIPLISWAIPAIGHVGICDSTGNLLDFQGPYTVGRNAMLFGNPRQKWDLPIPPDTLDQAIAEVTREFGEVDYNFFCSNCHFYVASCLERAGTPLPCCCSDWRTGATVKIIWSLILKGRSISPCDFLLIWVPFLVVVGVIVLLVWVTR
jgi:hypothetical protein